MPDNDLIDDITEEFNNGKRYSLNDYESNYVRELGTLLQFHTHREQIINNFIMYVMINRLGYTKVKQNHHIALTVDDTKFPFDIMVKEVPNTEP